MKKNVLKLCGIIGFIATIGGVIYALTTMNRVEGIEDEDFDDFEDEDGFLDFDEMYADEIEKDLENPSMSEKTESISFDKVNEDAVFAAKNETTSPTVNIQDEDADDLEEKTVNGVHLKVIDDKPINIVDYDTEYFEMVCNVSRQDAIKLIVNQNNQYTADELNNMTNSELADIYSKIIDD